MKTVIFFEMHRILKLHLIIWLLAAIVGCSKLIEIDRPIGQLTTTAVFGDSASATSAVMGLYSQVAHGSTDKIIQMLNIYPGLSADELIRNVTSAVEDEFTANKITVVNARNNTMWRSAYSQIYHINSLLENLTASTALADESRERLIGEALFLRGLHYFYLVNLYGNVPLALSSDYRVNASLSRSSIDDVTRQIVQDLKLAESMLQPTYPSTERVRANKWVASALLARVHLYLQDWDEAITYSTAVIQTNLYGLEPVDRVFLRGSQETIMQFYPNMNFAVNTYEGSGFIPASGSAIPSYGLTHTLLNAFEPGDLRRSTWVGEQVVGGTVYTYPYKYKVRVGASNADKTEYSVLLRLAEQYLIRAEALAQKGELDGAVADVDLIRRRAGLHSLAETQPSITQPELLLAIEHERQVELFTERGHRWFDLKRTGSAEEALAPLKPQFAADALLYPIPEAEMLLNPFLDQNEGYN